MLPETMFEDLPLLHVGNAEDLLRRKFQLYRQGFKRANPGCTEADVVRNFLRMCPDWADTQEEKNERIEIEDRIEKIR